MREEKKRWLDKVAECGNDLKVKDACSILFNCLDEIENNAEVVKEIKDVLGEGAWNALYNGIMMTVFGAFYINCEINEEEQQKRIVEFYKIFEKDIIAMRIKDDDKGVEA